MESREDFQQSVNDVKAVGRIGLQINVGKSKLLVVREEQGTISGGCWWMETK